MKDLNPPFIGARVGHEATKLAPQANQKSPFTHF